MTRPDATNSSASDRERGLYEMADIAPKGAWLTLAAVIVTLALVCAGVASLFGLFGGLREAEPLVTAAPRGAPMLQTDERADRAAIEARTRVRPLQVDKAMRQTVAAGWDSGK
jgi:hypothetical protein